jgi:hypothetical protein
VHNLSWQILTTWTIETNILPYSIIFVAREQERRRENATLSLRWLIHFKPLVCGVWNGRVYDYGLAMFVVVWHILVVVRSMTMNVCLKPVKGLSQENSERLTPIPVASGPWLATHKRVHLVHLLRQLKVRVGIPVVWVDHRSTKLVNENSDSFESVYLRRSRIFQTFWCLKQSFTMATMLYILDSFLTHHWGIIEDRLVTWGWTCWVIDV